jgi:hypothetical protein
MHQWLHFTKDYMFSPAQTPHVLCTEGLIILTTT